MRCFRNINSQYNPPKAFALQPTDWATIPIGGFNGYRQDSLGGQLTTARSSGSAHIGMMTLLLSLWALVHAFRNNNTISSREKYLVKFLSTTTILSLAGTLWISQFIVITSVSFVLLCALGIKSFSNWIDSDEHAQSRSFGGGGFNSTWRMGFSGYLGSPHLGSLDTVRWNRPMRFIRNSKQTALPKNTGDWALLSFPYFFQLQLSLP